MTRDDIIQIILATSGQSEGVMADAILSALQSESEPVARVTSNTTSGKWYVKRCHRQTDDDGTTIYHRDGWGVFSDADHHGDAEADARLISAAPDMLEVLKHAHGVLADMVPGGTMYLHQAEAIMGMIEAMIVKAEVSEPE